LFEETYLVWRMCHCAFDCSNQIKLLINNKSFSRSRY
jgi:hypothetical protein